MTEVTDVVSEESKNTDNEKMNKNSWFIFAAIIGPMLAAYVVFKTGFAMPTGTINKGELILPATSLKELNWINTNSESVDLFSNNAIWRMALVVNGECYETCKQQLYISRQVHIRLGEKARRVERLLINTGPAFSRAFEDYLKAEHVKLITLSGDLAEFKDTFANTNISEHGLSGHEIYYIDPQGFAMMSYSSEKEGGDLLKDIKRLLKYSYEEN